MIFFPQLLERVGKTQVPRAVRLFARTVINREQQVEQERTLGTLIQSKSDVADQIEQSLNFPLGSKSAPTYKFCLELYAWRNQEIRSFFVIYLAEQIEIGEEMGDLIQMQTTCLTEQAKNDINGHSTIQPTSDHHIVDQSPRLVQA